MLTRTVWRLMGEGEVVRKGYAITKRFTNVTVTDV